MNVKKMTKIIELHQPMEFVPCFANERFCGGCNPSYVLPDEADVRGTPPKPGTSYRTWPWSDFPRHQAEMIKAAERG